MVQKIKQNAKSFIAFAICVIISVACIIIYYDVPERLPWKKNTITIGVFSDSYWEVQNGYSYQIINDAIKVFEEQHPDAKVEYVSGILKNDYSEWSAEQLLAGKAPDVFFVLPEDFTKYAKIGALRDLTSIIKEDTSFDGKKYYASALKYGRYLDNQYALPYECAPKLMFVNKTILDKEGIPMPLDDWSWDDFYEICRAVTKDLDGNGTLDQFGAVDYTWQEAFESNGIELFNQEGTECNFTGDKVREGIEFIEKMEKINESYRLTGRDFDVGRVAFLPMSFSSFRAYKPYPLSVKKYTGFEWECIPMPAGPQGDNISTLDTLLVAMSEDTKNPEYAWDLIKCLTYNPEIQAEIFTYSEGISVLKNVTESNLVLQNLINSSNAGNSLKLSVLSDAVDHAVIMPLFRDYQKAVADVDEAVSDIIDSDANISMKQIVWNREINKKLKNKDM